MDILAIPMELKEQELIKDISGGLDGDLPWIVEAVSNIMKNCHEHMDFGGKLYVTASENTIYSEINGKNSCLIKIKHPYDFKVII